MEITLSKIAELVNGEVVGDPGIVITGVAGIKEARKGEITFVANQKYASLMEDTGASAIIVSNGAENKNHALIRTDDPYFAFTKVMELWVNGNGETPPPGIHPTAIIGEGVKLGMDVSIQAYVVIAHHTQIGDRAALYPHTCVGHHSRIGDDCLIYPRVTIKEKSTIGRRCIIHSGTVIGSDGFGFAPVKGVHHKVPQIGTVIIEDDVEIGVNVSIDRATIGKTIIGSGTKIDNLVQIAHNVVIGENSIIVAQVGISGSTTIGSGVTIAGQAGVAGHLRVGDNVIASARSGITKDVPANTRVSGFPAQPHEKEMRIKAALQKLPELTKTIRELEKRIVELEKKSP